MLEEKRTLISGNTYESTEYADGSVIIRTTHNGGNTFAVATVYPDGRVEGDADDLQTIIAECMDCSFEGVPDQLEDMSMKEWIFFQAKQDIETADMHADQRAQEKEEEIIRRKNEQAWWKEYERGSNHARGQSQ